MNGDFVFFSAGYFSCIFPHPTAAYVGDKSKSRPKECEEEEEDVSSTSALLFSFVSLLPPPPIIPYHYVRTKASFVCEPPRCYVGFAKIELIRSIFPIAALPYTPVTPASEKPPSMMEQRRR